jgi:hypothetical protein
MKDETEAAAKTGSGKTVDGYVAALAGWQAEVVSELRKIVRAAAPKATESIKWAQPVYDYNGPFVWIKAHKSHVNIGFWRGAQLTDPKGLLEGDGDRMRHLKIASPEDINRTALKSFVREAVKLNRTLGDPTKSAMKRSK